MRSITITIAPPPKTAGPPIQKQTTAGNRCVAHYPPFQQHSDR